MLRVDQVHVIRHKVLVEGLGVRRVAREMRVSRNTVRKYLQQSAPVRQVVKALARDRSSTRRPHGLRRSSRSGRRARRRSSA